jgi:hypothetical protein
MGVGKPLGEVCGRKFVKGESEKEEWYFCSQCKFYVCNECYKPQIKDAHGLKKYETDELGFTCDHCK